LGLQEGGKTVFDGLTHLSFMLCWLHPPSVDKCFVPSDALNEKAQLRGLDPVSQIVQYGLPIRKGFWSNTNGASTTLSVNRRKIPFFGKAKTDSATSLKAKLRQKLGLKTDLPTCLVVGGGDGMGGIVPISTALGKKLGLGNDDNSPKHQMVIVCGSNKDAQSKLQSMEWGPGVEVHVQGFVSNMDEWMNAADCLVTKAGPGTIAEASICGLPCMLFAYL
jgi:1,2-diacylglycerol 3-beta-galactosyltransferase